MRVQDLLREACPDLTDRLELLGVGVEACQEEGAVDVGAFAAAVVGADDDEVEGVADAGEVVLFQLQVDKKGPREAGSVMMPRNEKGREQRKGGTDLEPVHGSPAWLVRRVCGLEHLDHESFARVFDRLLEERLDLIRRLAVRRLDERELAFDLDEVLLEERPALVQLLLEQGLFTELRKEICQTKTGKGCESEEEDETDLSVQVEDVESEEEDLDGDVLDLDVLSLPSTELLERKQLLADWIPRNSLAVENKVDRVAFHALRNKDGKRIKKSASHMSGRVQQDKRAYARELFHEIRVLDAHVLRVSAEHGERPVRLSVDLQIKDASAKKKKKAKQR